MSLLTFTLLGLSVALTILIWWLSLQLAKRSHLLNSKTTELEQLRQDRHSLSELTQTLLQNSQKELQTQADHTLTNAVKPLSDELQKFQLRINEINAQENRFRGELSAKLEQLTNLNQLLGDEAKNLTRALKGDTQQQGQWGEMVLERVLELSGLRRDSEYKVQSSIHVENKLGRPDVIIYLPQGRQVVIDSKVSLTHYERYVNAETEIEQQQAGKAHVQSFYNHITQLANRDYTTSEDINSLDLVLMFVPIQSGWELAQVLDPQLFETSLQKKICIVTPNTLFPILRSIAQSWDMEHRSANAEEIARVSGTLVDKLANFVTDLEGIDKHLGKAQDAYQQAHKKLTSGRGNAISIANRLKDMRAKSHKSLPSHHDSNS